jgi:hypothetical protein
MGSVAATPYATLTTRRTRYADAVVAESSVEESGKDGVPVRRVRRDTDDGLLLR